MKRLYINISDIAIITGDNTFKTREDYLIEFWKKNAREDYENYVILTSYTKQTDNEIIENITTNNQIDIKKELENCKKALNTCELNKYKAEIMDKMKNVNGADKKEIEKSIQNVVHTNFGTKNENSIVSLYEEKTGNKLVKDDVYHSIELFTIDNFRIFIGGKVDGLTVDNKTIVEIKNRVYKLFYTLREYEKVQITAYMYLFTVLKSHLVEAFKKNNETTINIIEVLYDDEYMNNMIEKIFYFINDYILLLNNHDLKMKILKIG
jgi:hypothetical protein